MRYTCLAVSAVFVTRRMFVVAHKLDRHEFCCRRRFRQRMWYHAGLTLEDSVKSGKDK